MKLIGIAITPSLNLTQSRRIETMVSATAGVDMGPMNTSNNRSRFQVAVTDEANGFDLLADLAADYNVTLIPALEVHR